MNLRRSLSCLVAIAAPSASAAAFTPSKVDAVIDIDDGAPLRSRLPTSRRGSRPGSSILGGTTLRYKNYHSSYYEMVDVDGDRMSLLSLLEPPPAAAPRTKKSKNDPSEGSSKSRSRTASQRASPITQINSIQDYHRHVLHEPNQLCIIRFSAPWCKKCQSTNVAWERLASRISKGTADIVNGNGSGRRIRFFSVSLDGKDDATSSLKDMLQINRVPQGIIHHPTQGVFGQKVDLTRSNLSTLKRRLERYLEEEGLGSGSVVEGLVNGGNAESAGTLLP